MAKFNKIELATRFYFDGKDCIESAEILFNDKNRGHRSQYGILLIHGVELLLKSYLLIKNTNPSDNPKEINLYLKNLGHKYYNIYEECLKYGTDLDDRILKTHLDFLSNAYYEDSIMVRYIESSGLVAVDPVIFGVLSDKLIEPIHKLLFPKTPY